MKVDWIIIAIVLFFALILIIYLIRRNNKDKKKIEKFFNKQWKIGKESELNNDHEY